MYDIEYGLSFFNPFEFFVTDIKENWQKVSVKQRYVCLLLALQICNCISMEISLILLSWQEHVQSYFTCND